ncbi:MAG: outer membrane protein assembly factor BamA [Deltaproteobacteria bacterium RIFCSPLOWO2_12_FULL_40_28]|nr:MAG: outer membrane protein assembly factor BamA [Deltaproteobacteria bacterium RIFCSPHIGHO2_02_FULL_40_28]OGQ20480.1 MAG: outer membrane protein assembly factor BamA [Deltaproteobacteria bacterium RIFCSPHIGHO2_12_FULL_40_32]OGQ41110.1 MAG: outer membrane protein assembly factor BamA [Deltaproteobacteria bacterium RIFCSPLOWO2_02_FULL_40_36]OGQ55090.1 MAG: outer membrane protein assembly factor BamA [Deltaproteobacteria bacterium RIFCSPLOWO2_12_FULL_40_28]
MKKIFLFLFLFFSSSQVLANVEYQITSIECKPFVVHLDSKKVCDLCPLKKGDTVTIEKMNEVKNTLYGTRMFESVQLSITGQKTAARLLYEPIEARLIRKVEVKGNYPYLAKKVLRLSLLQPGDAYLEELIDESEKRIQTFFEKNGYLGTEVEILPELEKENYVANISIIISKGKTYRLGDATFIGNQYYTSSELKNKLFSFTHFKAVKIKRQLKDIEEDYAKNGFVRARVKLLDSKINFQKKQIDIVVEVQERKKLKIDFTGHSLFESATLRQQTAFYAEKGYDSFSVERSLDQLKTFYKINGFLNSNVIAKMTENENEVLVTFYVKEGPRTRLKQIQFIGLKEIDEGDLKKSLNNETHSLTRKGILKEELIPIDLENMSTFFNYHGFFDAKVEKWEMQYNRFLDQATLIVLIHEGAFYTLEDIAFNGQTILEGKQLRKLADLKKDHHYQEQDIRKAEDKILNEYLDRGYAYATIQHHAILDRENHKVSLTFQINEGPIVKVKNIIISGDYKTDQSTILNALRFKSGDVYRYKKILGASLNLKRLGIFDYVLLTPVGIEEQKDKVDIAIKLLEKKTFVMDVQAGFDSDKLGSGQIVIKKHNIFGKAKEIQLKTIGGFELNRGELTLSSPRIFGANWNLINQFFIQYEDDENFNASSYGGSVGVLKQFGPIWTLLMKSEITHFNIYESESNSDTLDENLFDSTFSEVTISAAMDKRDNFADPGKGFYIFASSEFDTDFADITNNFIINRFNTSHYLSFLNRFTLVNNLRFNKLSEVNNDARIPVQKLFFMGGNDTVRGFDEDAINSSGGTTSFIYNAELHYRLFSSFKLAGFFDTGSLTNSLGEISMDTFRESAGFGIRYFTPVGPIRLDYGFILNKQPGESGQRFHFSFGYFF